MTTKTKILFLFLMMVFSCCTPPPHDYPKYKYHQIVEYEVPEFYSLVCSGLGTIQSQDHDPDGVDYYTVYDLSDTCPGYFLVKVKDILYGYQN